MSLQLSEADLDAQVRPGLLGPLVAAELDDDGWRSFTTRLITGGKSNLTFESPGSRPEVPAGSHAKRVDGRIG